MLEQLTVQWGSILCLNAELVYYRTILVFVLTQTEFHIFRNFIFETSNNFKANTNGNVQLYYTHIGCPQKYSYSCWYRYEQHDVKRTAAITPKYRDMGLTFEAVLKKFSSFSSLFSFGLQQLGVVMEIGSKVVILRLSVICSPLHIIPQAPDVSSISKY